MVHATAGQHDASFKGFLFGPGGGATMAGAVEIAIFHPFDTVSKRLMSYEHRIIGSSLHETRKNVNSIIFKGIENGTFFQKVAHVYPGSLFAVYYKVSQRVIKFAGQPYAKDFLQRHYGRSFTNKLGDKYGKIGLEAVAGCLVGMSEVVLLPLDRLKVLSQTNKEALAGRGMFSIFWQEGLRKMYAGLCTTAFRNANGTFLLFGGTALTKQHVFGLEDYRKATVFQNMFSSTVGACMGVFWTAPMDVVKTRIQNKNFNDRATGVQIISQVIKNEGPQAFFKGITPKVMTTAPRLVLSFTLAQYFSRMLRGEHKK